MRTFSAHYDEIGRLRFGGDGLHDIAGTDGGLPDPPRMLDKGESGQFFCRSNVQQRESDAWRVENFCQLHGCIDGGMRRWV